MTVDSWQPIQAVTQISAQDLEKLLLCAQSTDLTQNLTADFKWIQPLAMLAPQKWTEICQSLNNTQLISLIKLFCKAEQDLTWDLGDKSPVIALFKFYRKQAGIDKELVQWVKSHSDNKFLPFGPLL